MPLQNLHLSYLFLYRTQHAEHSLTYFIYNIWMNMEYPYKMCTYDWAWMVIVKGYMILGNMLRTRCNLWWWIRHYFVLVESLIELQLLNIQSDYKIWIQPFRATSHVRNQKNINQCSYTKYVLVLVLFIQMFDLKLGEIRSTVKCEVNGIQHCHLWLSLMWGLTTFLISWMCSWGNNVRKCKIRTHNRSAIARAVQWLITPTIEKL